MAQIKKEVTKKMLDWYLEILQQWPQSKDLLYELEAEYSCDFTDFLINAAISVAGQNESLEYLIKLAQDYRDEVSRSIQEQRELLDTLMSALDSRICSIIEGATIEIEGSYDYIKLSIDTSGSARPVNIHFRLVDNGYLPNLLSHGQTRLDMSNKPVSEILSVVHEYIAK